MQALENAITELEEARVVLIERLTDEARENAKETALLHQEVRDLNTQRADLTLKWKMKEAQQLSEKVATCQATIREHEATAKRLEQELTSARDQRHPELSSFMHRVQFAHTQERINAGHSSERHFLELVSDELRDSVKALIAATGPQNAERVVLAALHL